MDEHAFKPTLEAIPEVIAFLEQEMEKTGVPMKIAVLMNVAADEIFSNIARYSGAETASVGFFAREGEIRLRFSDNGRPYDPTAKPDPDVTLDAEERSVGGLGIFMVKKTMEKMEYAREDGWNVLTITKQYP